MVLWSSEPHLCLLETVGHAPNGFKYPAIFREGAVEFLLPLKTLASELDVLGVYLLCFMKVDL